MIDKLISKYFYETPEIKNPDYNPVKFHPMTVEHEEVLGQFLDRTGFDYEELKRILVLGYVEYVKEAHK